VIVGPQLSAGSVRQEADRDSWGMVVIADLPFGLFEDVPCGDADRDGRNEFYAGIFNGAGYIGYSLEHMGNNAFVATALDWNSPHFECLADPDCDGLCDLIFRNHWNTLCVYESPDSFSVPRDSVWSFTTVRGSSFLSIVTDLDLDSAREITARTSTSGKLIDVFECVGDNRYELATQPGIDGSGEPGCIRQTLDLDRNGLPELAVGTWPDGWVDLYEAIGDDTLALRGSVRLLLTSDGWIQDLTALPDLDQDGKTELLACCFQSRTLQFVVAVVEATSPDSFQVVWADTTGGRGWNRSLACGDIDGDSAIEFMAADGDSVGLYRCTGDDMYECFWARRVLDGRATLYDINSDGRAELLYAIPDTDRTIIREWLPVGVEERAAEALHRVVVQPSLVQRGEVICVIGLPQSAGVEVVDASGRVISSLFTGNWPTGNSPPGAYFIHIRLGNQTAVRKLLVVE